MAMRTRMLVSALTSALWMTHAAVASPLGTYDAIIDKTSAACLTIGDAISCSAPLLNYLDGLAPTTTVANGGYVLPTPQGALDSYIVVGAGGGAQDNSDIDPAPPSEVENGFKTNDVTNDDFMATGKADGTTVTAGNMNDPDNNGLVAGDNVGTWDVGVNWLLDALTINGQRRELMIGFDYNQPQNTTTSLDYWALITVRDLDGVNADMNFEIRSPTGQSNILFSTSKTFASQPASTDFATVNGVTCVDDDNILPILPISGGQCPAGYETAIDNAQSTSDTEIFAFIPELNENLLAFSGAGYDVISARILFGCFGGTPGGSFQPGIGYLSDESTGGATTNCEGGGFGDVYLLAGQVMTTQMPEPGSLALLGLGLWAACWSRSRLRVRSH